METDNTREAWLDSAVEALRPLVEHATESVLGPIKVSVGFPSHGALANRHRKIGQCWHRDAINKEAAQVFISPRIDNNVDVLAVLIHELLHGALPIGTGHRKLFSQAAKRIGLEGKPTSPHAGETLTRCLNAEFLPKLGPYPHKAFEAANNAKQSTRNRLYVCPCGVKVRTARELNATCDDCEEKFERA